MRRNWQGKLKVIPRFLKINIPRSKLKTNNVLGNRQGRNDSIASTPKDKAEILSKFLAVSSLMKSWQVCRSLPPVQILT